MEKVIDMMVNELSKLMEDYGYRIYPPVSTNFLESMTKANSSNTDLPPVLKDINNDILFFLKKQPDYVYFLTKMDGFEFDGVILYSFALQLEENNVPINNIFLYNDNFRNNDICVNTDLSERVVIGQDSISFFTYDLKENVYQIRDNVGTEKIFGSFDNFSDFLREILDTVA
ncbi:MULTISPECIES: YrhA family protein [Enterobacter]|uniref:YrhA family protein n=1 Tax=Enterobacter TaxID=547 RepID=UPI000A5A5130|nr:MULTISPECIES: YrhA family protein [Enterobacter]MDX7473207.1 YrhA family protein [Enterobacter bugandensis]